MRFIDFLKNKALNEMAVERRVAISVSDSQFNSVRYKLYTKTIKNHKILYRIL